MSYPLPLTKTLCEQYLFVLFQNSTKIPIDFCSKCLYFRLSLNHDLKFSFSVSCVGVLEEFVSALGSQQESYPGFSNSLVALASNIALRTPRCGMIAFPGTILFLFLHEEQTTEFQVFGVTMLKSSCRTF